MPVATVTQTGGITSPVTINAFAGTINLFSFNVPAYPGIYSYGFTVNNTYCSAGDIVLISAQSSFVVYGVTFISSNSFNISLTNPNAVTVAAGPSVSFLIIKKAV